MQLAHQIRGGVRNGTRLGRVRERLRPAEGRDAGFRRFVDQFTAPGVRTLGCVEMAAALLFVFGGSAGAWWQAAALFSTGAATLWIVRLWRRRTPRWLGAVSAWCAASLLLSVSAWKDVDLAGADDYILAAVTLVLVTAAAILPLLPLYSLAMGLGVEGVYILSSVLGGRAEFASGPLSSEPHHVFLLLLALLVSGISAVHYGHRRAEYEHQREAVRAAEAVTGAQLRAQLAENAISVGKMAAALSHEINSPLGTLRSSVHTLVALTDRQVDGPPEERARLAGTRTELVRSIEESAARIDEVTRMLRRFVALEDSDIKEADINDLLSDVALLHREELEAAHVKLEMRLEKALPPLNCRPQLLSAVFSTLLANAIQAVNGDGRIGIETRARGGEMEVTIRDNGRGMRPETADTAFDPSFRVADGRVASGNWGLFNSRQIVYEHGGDIRLETAEGRGTAVHVTLPVG